MIYDLPLDVPGWKVPEKAFTQDKIHKERLESLRSLEKKLNYFNANIRSLSTYSMMGKIEFEWGNFDQTIKVFCNCYNCRKLPDFNKNDEKLFFRLRDKEVKRIVKTINSAPSYKEKLKVYFDIKGYYPDNPTDIISNFPFDPSKDIGQQTYFQKSVISLIPTTKAEIEIYNGFVKAAFEKHYKEGNGFSKYYNGFDFEKEKARLNNSLANAVTPEKLLSLAKNKIENHYKFNDVEVNENHITKAINKNLIQNYGHIPFMFPKMIMGVPIPLNENRLYIHTFFEITHTEQVVKYYKYVKDLIEGRELEKEKRKTDVFVPLLFKDLFISPGIINDCLKLLQETERPCINDENEFIRDKGVFVVWFNAMEAKKMFKEPFLNNDQKAQTLNINFKGLNVSGSLFKYENRKATDLYKQHFMSEISGLKS